MIIQKQILDLLKSLQGRFGFSIIMISHDIRVVRYLCQTLAIMRDGTLTHILLTNQLVSKATDLYTKNLLDGEIHLPDE